ncbi:hypothetical protein [Haloquadratum walsbyi]|uniref:hypothetical protein n=1 Tax=Haloquadratum walsbyi TaxID=293091 RepID=UPI0026F061DC|nr:hypothetical protein [Haloquadratum walsbyi]
MEGRIVFVFVFVSVTRSACLSEKAPMTELHALDGTLGHKWVASFDGPRDSVSVCEN